mgnify:CR=1 FL=1
MQQGSLSDPRRWLVVGALGISQIVGYGTLYYAFSVLAPAIAADLSWSMEWLFGAFSLSLLAAGLIAPRAGRWIDRFGAGWVMMLGSIASAIALLYSAVAPEPVSFTIGLIGISVSSTCVQYSAAFALLVQIDRERAQQSITYLTLIAGFASTIFWPLTAGMMEHLSWRSIDIVFAVMHLTLCLPIHAYLSAWTRPGRVALPSVAALPIDRPLVGLERSQAFTLMVVGFALGSFVNAAVLVHMLPILGALGLGAASVLVSTLFGPSQVLSRLTNMLFGKELSQISLAIISAGLMPLGVAILMSTAPWLPGAVAFAVVFGLGSGLNSIVQGTLPLSLFGQTGYGRRIGQITAARLVASATAPFVLAFLISHVGVGGALGLATLCGIGSVAAFLRIGFLVRSNMTPDAAGETP